MSEDGDGHVTFRELRALADKLVLEAESRAEKAHAILNELILRTRDDAVRLSGAFENHVVERRDHDAAVEAIASNYRIDTEKRISKLEANQYIQVALLAITLIAAVVGLFRAFLVR